MRSENNSPPETFLRLFRWFCHPSLRQYIEGDLIELYNERLELSGKRIADIKFAADVVLLFRPGIIKPVQENTHPNLSAMYKSYFKVGWRNLLRNKGYSAINIGGLALGMTVAMLISLWVYDELSYNKYFKNYDRIVQIMKAGTFEGRHYVGQVYLPYPLISELETSYGQNFKHVVPSSGPGGWSGVLAVQDKVVSKTGMYIGEGAPEMFTFKMIKGNWSALKDLHSIIISESTAKSLFGDVDPIDRFVKVNSGADAKVTGVYADFPKNTDLYGIQFFQPWSFYVTDAAWIPKQGWDNHFLFIYAELAPNRTFREVATNIKDAEVKAIKNLEYMKEELKYNYEILLHPMRDWHLSSNFKEGVLQNGPMQMVWFIGAIGAFVLLLACINFMNLSTARSEKRSKEVGIRKAIGSIRKQLIGQFFSESFLVVIVAFAFTLGIVTVLLPWFNVLSSKDIQIPWNQPWFAAGCLIFLFITGMLAGSYPALYLSSFSPVTVLKGVFRAGKGASIPRRVLVVVQFTVSVVLIICTTVIYDQLMFVKNRPVGYTREGLIMIRKKSAAYDEKLEAIRNELYNTGVVESIAGSGGQITGTWSHNGGFSWKGKDPSFEANFATLNVSPEFGKTVGWEFIDGRDLSPDIASDSSGIILNEAAVKYMNIKKPVGEVVHWTNRAWGIDQDFHVVGVIKDMLMNSPFDPVKPAIYFTSGNKGWILIRVRSGVAMTEALPKIEKVFTSLIPEIPFDRQFADEQFAAKFSNEERIGKLAALFTGLAIGISCLGLFGLASFVAEQKTKEIGIRKVLGASVANLWKTLSKEFLVLVAFSCLIATPISYYILNRGLERYEYKTDIGWWTFIAASAGAFVITLATVSFQSVKAALANPVTSLRSE